MQRGVMRAGRAAQAEQRERKNGTETLFREFAGLRDNGDQAEDGLQCSDEARKLGLSAQEMTL